MSRQVMLESGNERVLITLHKVNQPRHGTQDKDRNRRRLCTIERRKAQRTRPSQHAGGSTSELRIYATELHKGFR